MEKTQYQKLFLFAAKAGSLEGYLFERKELEPLDNWIGNIVDMYRELPSEVKSEINPSLTTVLKRALDYGGDTLKPELREKLEQVLLEASHGLGTGK